MPLDPRLQGGRGSANEILADRAIRHALFVERFKAGQAHRIVRLVDKDVIPDLLRQIERRLMRIRDRGFDTSPQNTRRLAELVGKFDDLIDPGMRDAERVLRKDLQKFARSEVNFHSRLIREAAAPIQLDLNSPSVQTLRSVVRSRPFQGRLLRDWFRGLGAGTKSELRRQIQIGVAEGESVPQIMRRLKGSRTALFGDGPVRKLRRQTEAVVRTSVQHVANGARNTLYEENTEVIKGVQWLATLDTRTTEICMALDGKVFPVDKGPRPPAHIQCRSTTTPVLRSWKELGINLREAPEGTRESMNGQVPATTTYGDWLRRQPAEVQDEALGKGKAALFRRGVIPIERFTDSRNRILSLRELEALERAKKN